MATLLVSQGSCCPSFGLANQGRTSQHLSFSSSISDPLEKLVQICNSHSFNKAITFRVTMSQTGSQDSKVKLVHVSEVVKTIRSLDNTNNKVEMVNSTNQVVNGTSIVKRDAIVPIVKTLRRIEVDKFPPREDLGALPSDKGYSWANENYNNLQRTIHVWSFIISLRIRIMFDNAKWAYLGGFTEEKQKRRRQKTASWIREQMLQLGPTFIKLGQLSSTRSDIFPKEYVAELTKLQDKVPALSFEKARTLIESELGSSIEMLFKEFEEQPIAAASLGQVHRAILHNGEKVVVKVQRPGLKNLFDIDLRNMKLLTHYLQRSEKFGGPSRDWIGIYKECYKILFQEIDYINEGKNADRFRRDFRNVKWVRAPLVFWDYTSTRVLTLEYVPGVKINEIKKLKSRGYDRSRIASRVIEAYLIQILKTGFFHADPHPGNVAIDEDEALIYYDFGMMGELNSSTCDALLRLFYAVYEKDTGKVIESLIDLGALQPTRDLTSVRRSVQFFLDNLLTQTIDKQQMLSAIGEDLYSIAKDQTFRFPTTFAFIIRAFSTLEGIGHTLDPNYSFPKIAAPYAQELLEIRQKWSGPELVQEMRKQADDARSSTMSMPYRVQRIEEFVKKLEAGDIKLRVRVLESERAAEKATVLQIGTIYTILGGTLLNVGVTLLRKGSQLFANGSFAAAGIFLILFVMSMQRVKKLDKIEKII